VRGRIWNLNGSGRQIDEPGNSVLQLSGLFSLLDSREVCPDSAFGMKWVKCPTKSLTRWFFVAKNVVDLKHVHNGVSRT